MYDEENWIPNSVEIQIADDHPISGGRIEKIISVGQFLVTFGEKVVNKPGEWNKLQLTCKGQQIDIVLNGKKVTSMDMAEWTSGTTNPDGSEIPSWLPTPFAELPTKGSIGLQGKHGDSSISFRNVRIKAL